VDAGEHLVFGYLLRQHRNAAGLTQEDLAERAGLSVDTISLLERGEHRRPHRYTMQSCRESLVLSRKLDNKSHIALCLTTLAGVIQSAGQATRAARLFGAAEMLLRPSTLCWIPAVLSNSIAIWRPRASNWASRPSRRRGPRGGR
jgi:transcriptional regulator with XRE-family HTH domain